MRFRGAAISVILPATLAASSASAQVQSPSERLILSGKTAATWTEGASNIVDLHGPVHIELDRVVLTADDAVIWLTPVSADDLSIQTAQISLIGHAKLEQKGITREGTKLFVTDPVRSGEIHIVADERVARDDSASDLFRRGLEMRLAQPVAVEPLPPGPASTTRPSTPGHPATHPPVRPAAPPKFDAPVEFEAENVRTVNTDDGFVAIILQGRVRLIQQRNVDYVELSADNAVLFTRLKSLKELKPTGTGKKQGNETIVSAYLENDVRIDYTPQRKGIPEQRLSADRVYYEFATDRAILTDAVVHSNVPQTGTPIIMRAKVVRQLSQGEFDSENAKLTNSQFALPSYAIAADRLYMHAEPTGDPRIGDRITYDAHDMTIQAFDVPFFYMPHVAGSMTEHGFALRGLNFGHDSDFGSYGETLWGLFETLGSVPPRDLDVNFRADYFSARGPAGGLNAKYDGGFVTDTTKQAWDFDGQFQSYFVYDKGQDDVGRLPVRVDDDPALRGQVLWEHQHFFPDGWQRRPGLDMSPMEHSWSSGFATNSENGPARDVMGYLKHQQDSSAFTFGAVYQPLKLVTTSENQQEQFEVEHLPEIAYYREGDSLLNDHLTLFSENVGDGLHFARSRDSLADQGFAPPTISPGLPAEGYTGLTGQVIWRGDFRQQVDYPFSLGPLRVDPYVMGRYTGYTNSPQGDRRDRLMAGAGTRVTTELWKADPTAESELFDIHQIRHVIEPEMNFFTSAMNIQRDQVFVYDPQTDAINDISAAQFALHQRWETKRGGPGAWRSVDVFSLNVEVDAFVNKPARAFNNPSSFRGLFFSSYPEESVPRDSVNADASWRLSDNTVVLGDMSYNLDRGSLQTLALGVLVQRDQRLSYFIGNRYIDALSSNITSVHMDYQMTSKYLFDVDQEFDFTQGKNVVSSAAIIRRFDTFLMAFRYTFDETTHENGVSFNLFPIGLGQGLDTQSFNTFRK